MSCFRKRRKTEKRQTGNSTETKREKKTRGSEDEDEGYRFPHETKSHLESSHFQQVLHHRHQQHHHDSLERKSSHQNLSFSLRNHSWSSSTWVRVTERDWEKKSHQRSFVSQYHFYVCLWHWTANEGFTYSCTQRCLHQLSSSNLSRYYWRRKKHICLSYPVDPRELNGIFEYLSYQLQWLKHMTSIMLWLLSTSLLPDNEDKRMLVDFLIQFSVWLGSHAADFVVGMITIKVFVDSSLRSKTRWIIDHQGWKLL